jgi:hypothetical protein
LLSGDQDRNPSKLPRARDVGAAGHGIKPYGMGFVFEDGDPDCEPVSVLKAILERFPDSSVVVHRFLGGSDLNSHPRQCPERYIIDFGEISEPAARSYAALMDVVERRVRPTREALTTQSGAQALKRTWWQFGYRAIELIEDIRARTVDRVLVTSQTSKYRVFAFAPAAWVFDQKVVVFVNSEDAFFSVLQSRCHEEWAEFLGSTMKDDPVYTPSDCFETFPLPPSWNHNDLVRDVGVAYQRHRSSIMHRENIGLTELYNRFHDPDQIDADVLKLRELHAAIDRAILDAYGWADVHPTCEFLLDYEEEDDDGDASGRRKKKPWRYCWPDDVRDDVLARLLELNARRAKEQAGTPPPAGPATPTAAGKKPRGRAKAKKPTAAGQGGLFGEESE